MTLLDTFTDSWQIPVQTGSLSSEWGNRGAEYTYDNDLETSCHTLKQTMNRLTLNFVESHVTYVEIFNVEFTPHKEFIMGAVVKLLASESVVKVCGTFSDISGGSKFVFDCDVVGSRLDIELANEHIVVAEVKIYGQG